MDARVQVVSTREVDDLAGALGVGSGISKSEVSRIGGELDGDLDAFRTSVVRRHAVAMATQAHGGSSRQTAGRRDIEERCAAERRGARRGRAVAIPHRSPVPSAFCTALQRPAVNDLCALDPALGEHLDGVVAARVVGRGSIRACALTDRRLGRAPEELVTERVRR
jgi:hypothetical protein